MNDWTRSTLGDLIAIQRGHDLPADDRRDGPVPIIGSFGITGYHDTAKGGGPGVAIGRSGASIGQATYVAGPFWPLNTCLYVTDFKGNDPRWVYRLLDSTDFTFFNSGSAQPSLNRNFLRGIPLLVPPLSEQQAIAEVLGALDDKVAANAGLSSTAEAMAALIYEARTAGLASQRMSDVLTPVLGGTPARSNTNYWGGQNLWISAKDVTGAANGVVIDTEETITDQAILETKAKPLPTGSVILTARGTVGAVARLGRPASFNQSCYGFVPGDTPAGVLYFAIRKATDHAKSLAHGSVFDTITMKTFDHLYMPDLSGSDSALLEAKLDPLLKSVAQASIENRTLAATRDALLPQLMSGKLRVKDAEALVANAV